MSQIDASYEEAIAIVGMGCRFPGANNIDEFWRNLQEGVDSLTYFTNKELLESGVKSALFNNPNYVNAAYILDDIELFDASFFGYLPEEAEVIDPQQRLLLECAYETLEDAGYDPQAYEGATGVFAGVRNSGFGKIVSSLIKQSGTSRSFEAMLGTSVDQTCMRISYCLNLKGPSVGVQTACSTSLVAVHMACESLKNGECDMVLAGAAGIFVPQRRGYLYEEGMISSPDGYCRAFDLKAKGTGAGNGLGMVLLKRFSDALADHDHIYALIRGAAVNNDGSSKMGYRAPSVEGETAVIAEALDMADVEAKTITYIEANGTGTFLGDSIEIEALTRAFRSQTDRKGFCGIGSVKTNIGHLTQAAGIAGLIKTVLSLKHRQLPPSLHFETPNPKLHDSPFFVNTTLSEWEEANGFPRRAGVNSFAIGGTNAHVILEEAPSIPQPAEKEEPSFHILTIAAKSENALQNMTAGYVKFLKSHPEASIADICFTSNIGRSHYPFRLSAVADSIEQLYESIGAFYSEGKPAPGLARYTGEQAISKIAFLFSGVDADFTGISRNFYNTQPHFREAIDRCANILKTHHNESLLSVLLGDSKIGEDVCAQTAIFALEYALACMWRSWGIEPSVVMGHGVGEYVAACVAEVFSVEDGLGLVAARGCVDRDAPVKGENTGFAFFKNAVARVAFVFPKIEMVSSSTGCLLKNTEICEKDYWCRKAVEPAGIDLEWNYFQKQGIDYFMEIGPDHGILETWRKSLSQEKFVILQSLNRERDEWWQILECLGELYVRGVNVNWKEFTHKCLYRRVSLPTYPFERKRCWFDG